MKPTYEIVNVVGTASMGVQVDLERVDKLIDGVRYEPDTFPGMIMRLAKPKCSALLFKSGKAVCSGATSTDMAAAGVVRVAEILRSVGVDADESPQITITNMVATSEIGCRVRQEAAARSIPRSMYDPDMFPGTVCRRPDTTCVILLFASGKMVCTGAKTEADIVQAVNQMATSLEQKGLLIENGQ